MDRLVKVARKDEGRGGDHPNANLQLDDRANPFWARIDDMTTGTGGITLYSWTEFRRLSPIPADGWEAMPDGRVGVLPADEDSSNASTFAVTTDSSATATVGNIYQIWVDWDETGAAQYSFVGDSVSTPEFVGQELVCVAAHSAGWAFDRFNPILDNA